LRFRTSRLLSLSLSLCLAIPALTSLLGSVTDTLNCNWERAYANEFTVAVEEDDVGKLRTIAEEAIDLIGWGGGYNFGKKASWNSNPEWSC